MQPKSLGDHQKLLTEVIKKQIVILGPDITLAKARNVAGLIVADDGTVIAINGDPQQLTQKLVDQFMELSGLIVKKTMEPLLANSMVEIPMPTIPIPTPTLAATPVQPVAPTPSPTLPQPNPVVTPTPRPETETASNAASPIANNNTDVQQSEKQE